MGNQIGKRPVNRNGALDRGGRGMSHVEFKKIMSMSLVT